MSEKIHGTRGVFTVAFRNCALAAGGLLLSSCATLYDPLPPVSVELSAAQLQARRDDGSFTGVSTLQGAALRDAIIHIEERQRQLASARRRHVVTDGRLGTGILVGAAATTTAAVFGGPRDLIAGLALATGFAQTGRSLYLQRGYDGSYLSAYRALGCLSRASRVSLDAHVRTEDARVRLERERAVIQRLAALDADAAGTALAAIATDLATADSIRDAAGSLARQGPVAADSIMDTASEQLARQMPDPEAFASAVQAAGAFTRPNLPRTEAAPESVPGAPIATSGGDRSQDLLRLRTAIANVTALRPQMEAARTDFESRSREALKSCGFTAAAAPAPLSLVGVEKNAVSLKKGERIRFEIEGGSGNYFTSVIGQRPAGVDLAILGSSVEIAVDPTSGAPGAFQLRIRDAAADVPVVNVAVTVAS